MNKRYRRTKTTVSLINYHFVFCPKYRRKIFLFPGVEERFKTYTKEICEQKKIQFLQCLPDQSPSDIMRWIKGASSRTLRDEFPELAGMTSLWTRSFFVSTAGSVSSDTIQRYVEEQKTRL